MSKKLKVALIHDYLREYGGAERVLEALHDMYPDAPVYVSFVDEKAMGMHWQRFAGWDIRQTWFAKIPLIKKIYSPLRVLVDKAFMSLDLAEYDLVISSSNAFEAKAVQVPNGTHICYCHTPPRALYGYSTMTDWKKNPIIKFAGAIINHYMRIIDFKHAQKVDHFIANSAETARRIKKFYRRESKIINPPIDVPTAVQLKKYQQQADKKYHTNYYLYLNRLSFSKHPDLAVQAANQLGINLKVVGSGKMEPKLKEMAGDNIDFMGVVSDEELHVLLAGAKGLIYPVENEDFGMVPVEAMAHGVPVISHQSGGPLETVTDGETGIFFKELTIDGLVKAINRFKKTKFNSQKIFKHAQQFSKNNFEKSIKSFIAQL
ncbi:MAG: glycosyltransferase [Candidatus Pacebacteria bacterium]|jgi:glycosyltransferase involved in cell wall biosynthesis|nr:glycosyltransferase [Candidatus Paceibacterota bacterium]MBT3511467.1 glycosyltransferase [Candidatus Paceibacterota bacterium]MBT4004679.1 glycosyltransferase [Candidatus Paceibacterota bacterium]MBT4358402.1 glycosyltransferase [Candidatus Paceibacterota bacterium]MBT4680837.1 glycosyltransferase [Candidatus Paceibacterota bacterium]